MHFWGWPMKVLIVGGVAGGASCAARLRRLDEEAEIIVIERGPDVSFANCGLPYYVGNVIKDVGDLNMSTPWKLRERFRIEVRTQEEVVSIDRQAREVMIRNVRTKCVYRESYDRLVLSPGATPFIPSVPGVDLPGIFTLRNIPDSERIRTWMTSNKVRRAVIVGAGFIGVEMAENLVARGVEVTMLEMADQVLPPLDKEMAQWMQEHLETRGVQVVLNDAGTEFQRGGGDSLVVMTRSGGRYEADMVILSNGVRPEVKLARDAGLLLGERGGIRVDDQMRTSDPLIFAVGDAVEVKDVIQGQWMLLALAGPANRQGRIAADVICGRDTKFRGVQGTAICGAFGLAVAMTGASEKALKRSGMSDYEKVYLHPGHHSGYYPGAKPIHLKLIFRKSDGLILGAQAVGEEGAARRIDVLAMGIQMGATVFDLEQGEYCYAPQYGAAKDPLNMAGMIAANALKGDGPLVSWEEWSAAGPILLDVRDAGEFREGHIPNAIHIPLSEIRRRTNELPRDREIWTYCAVGQRGYYATRLLKLLGYRARNLPGGYTTYRTFHPRLAH